MKNSKRQTQNAKPAIPPIPPDELMALVQGANEIGGICSGDANVRRSLVVRGLAKWIGDGQSVQITDAGVALIAQNLSTDSTDGPRFKAPNKSVQSA